MRLFDLELPASRDWPLGGRLLVPAERLAEAALRLRSLVWSWVIDRA